MPEYPVVCQNCGTVWPDDHFERQSSRMVYGACCKRRDLTVWLVSCWIAGTWNGLAWGMWDGVVLAEDFAEVG